MKEENLNIIGIECDVSSERSVQNAFTEVMNKFGRVDSVVASAGEYLHLLALTGLLKPFPHARHRRKLLCL
jgi:NAD(P)-dependent dehydrogenase (short-subunit alcohol dehydrogenase family)